MNLDELKSEFRRKFGAVPLGAVRAPGRVNLIGEHTDYNGGFVLPIAIEKQTVALYAPRGDRSVRFFSLQASTPAAVELDEPIAPGEPAWANYCKGVAAGLIAAGVPLVGCDVLFDSDVPLGGGLSSSASLEVASAFAMLSAAGAQGTIGQRDLALLCQRGENVFAGAPCGIMDQTIAILARAGHALLLDCRSGETRHVPFDAPEVVLLVADTQVSHDIGGEGYPLRRAQSTSAAKKLGVASLRDAHEAAVASAAANGTLDKVETRRARHVVGEIARTLQAVESLAGGDYAAFGRLMYASHASLRDDYEVSCEELDAIVELAAGQDGVYGARMTGGGFGGCAIILAAADKARTICGAVSGGFVERFARACPIFQTRACAGAEVLE